MGTVSTRHQNFRSFSEEDMFCENCISSEQWYGDRERNDSFVFLSYSLSSAPP
jgi:hypothetical protein